MKTWKKVIVVIIIVLLVAAAGFVVWGETPAGPMPEAILAMRSDPMMNVITGKWLIFTPLDQFPDTGFIFYPGGRVDYMSYAPQAREIAAQGYLVVIVRMPLSLAVFGSDRASDVIAAYPNIKHWVVGGHSLGGSMAAHFAALHPNLVQGLVLWASYPASSDNLSNSKLLVCSIYGSQDGLATPAKIDASKPLLPVNTKYIEINGGNHAQFGWYGDQGGDNPASINREAQQVETVNATVELLQEVQQK